MPGAILGALKPGLDRVPKALAIAFDLAPPDAGYAGMIRGAQVRAVVRLTPVAIIASCLNAALFLLAWASVRPLPWPLLVWGLLIVVAAAHYIRTWLRGRGFAEGRGASRRALRRSVLQASLFGALWAFVPAYAFPAAPGALQLFIGCLTAGMMCAGGFVLATVPLAAIVYVLLLTAGSMLALAQVSGPVYLALAAMLAVYTAVIVVNVCWSAMLFVSSRLAEAQVRTEVAARELAQEKAAHSERLAALGQLAGGIAHDFNNVLQAISGAAALIERHAGEPERIRRQTGRILGAVERGGAIGKRLLAFARRDVLRSDTVDAGRLLEELAELLAPIIGPSIRIRREASSPALRFNADRRQLETVLVNLAANARDAMPGGGTLTISAASELVGDDPAFPGRAPGAYVRLSLGDTGAGMDPATLARAAEPFFTTKPTGRGTGLGVSMAKAFAEQSGGAFRIVSTPGQGTTVTLWLPQAEAVQAAPDLLEPASALRPRGYVLVVDDDDFVRETMCAGLDDAGFPTLGAPNGAEALVLFDRTPDVAAVVTDLSMPGISGWELVGELRIRRPDLPILMLTGHVASNVSESLDRFVLLQKPVSATELAERLAAMVPAASVDLSA